MIVAVVGIVGIVDIVDIVEGEGLRQQEPRTATRHNNHPPQRIISFLELHIERCKGQL